MHNRRREALETRIAALQKSYEELLERGLSDQDTEEIKSRLAEAYTARQEGNIELAEELKKDVARKAEENQQLKTEIDNLQQRIKSGAIANGVANGINGKTVQQQIAEFDNMKKSLMRDLQNRCERVCLPIILPRLSMKLILIRLNRLLNSKFRLTKLVSSTTMCSEHLTTGHNRRR